MKRLEDYLDNKEKKCKDVYRVHVTDKTTLDLCGDVMKVSKSCRLVIIRWVISCWGKKKVYLNIAHVYICQLGWVVLRYIFAAQRNKNNTYT